MLINRESVMKRTVMSVLKALGGAKAIDTATSPVLGVTVSKSEHPHDYIRTGLIEATHRKFDLSVVCGGISGVCVTLALVMIFFLSARAKAKGTAQVLTLQSAGLQMKLQMQPFRYSFYLEGKQVVGPDSVSGIMLGAEPVIRATAKHCSHFLCMIDLYTKNGHEASLSIKLDAHCAHLELTPRIRGVEVRFQTAGASPAYGLADQAILHRPYNTDVTGFSDDHFHSGQGISRLVSNFIIYPRQNFALVLVDPNVKIVQTSERQIVQGVAHANSKVNLYYFFGTPHDIYERYLRVRNDSGYTVFPPKYAMFGVGWEAFGALGWNTNQATVRESVDHYLALGYPLSWVVIGSGYWPQNKHFHETTSFGLFNHHKYPDPRSLIAHFHSENLKVLLGLRISFIVNGPFAAEGVAHHYFLTKGGQPKVFHGSWPKSPYYLLNAYNPRALNWYISLVKRWTDYGVDGFKEDLFDFGDYGLRDDKVDPVNDRLMKQGKDIIERNGYLSSNGDLQRINDFNYNEDQDRGPVNALALAYSGFPLVYPDIVGGTFGEHRFSTQPTRRMDLYMMRNAQWAALHSAMGMGEPPWYFSDLQVGKTMLEAAKLHSRLQPYLYSQGIRFSKDGYPWTMTPLPIAYPHDPQVYGRGNERIRGYEWMIGDALLATPLYGNDYATARTRNVYLPRGEWIDYDTGKIYKGPLTLKNFGLPVGKTPLFVGGTGIVVEKIGGVDVARVYPVTRDTSTVFYSPNAQRPDKIYLSVSSWKNLTVVDTTTGRTVEVHWVRHAYQWKIKPDNDYRLE